jgi:hypothetical protein
LADALPDRGRMTGRRAAFIVDQVSAKHRQPPGL